jgi:hypothetical protein
MNLQLEETDGVNFINILMDIEWVYVYIVLLLLSVIVTVIFIFKHYELREKRVKKLNFKAFHQLNHLLKNATQSLCDILLVVESEVHICISERVNLLEEQVESLNYCINELNIIIENCVEHELRKACMDSIFILEHAVKKTTIQLFNMSFITHDFLDYFLKITAIRLKVIHLEKKFNKNYWQLLHLKKFKYY